MEFPLITDSVNFTSVVVCLLNPTFVFERPVLEIPHLHRRPLCGILYLQYIRLQTFRALLAPFAKPATDLRETCESNPKSPDSVASTSTGEEQPSKPRKHRDVAATTELVASSNTSLNPLFANPDEFATLSSVECKGEGADHYNKISVLNLTHSEVSPYAVQQMVVFMLNDTLVCAKSMR